MFGEELRYDFALLFTHFLELWPLTEIEYGFFLRLVFANQNENNVKQLMKIVKMIMSEVNRNKRRENDENA